MTRRSRDGEFITSLSVTYQTKADLHELKGHLERERGHTVTMDETVRDAAAFALSYYRDKTSPARR